MFLLEDQLCIWLCQSPTDMRCSFEGLAAKVCVHLQDDPRSQLFDRKSERALPDPAIQPGLFAAAAPPAPAAEGKTITCTRRAKQRSADCVTDSGRRFDASVPRQVIRLPVCKHAEQTRRPSRSAARATAR